MYEYNVTVTKVVDGDTVDVDIDLGFGMTYKKQRVRLMGIDTPESRTRDLVEKLFGKASKKHLKEIIQNAEMLTLVSHDKGKFGRILGELYVYENVGHPQFEVHYSVNQKMIDDHHAVDYAGGNKEQIQEQHLKHRQLLIEEGVVTQEDIDKVS
jgi:micrococcal nuclease|tara:strand:- start:1254 stop:1715 length:462 start_codon:yes stop_codon:yes gene_type:complete